MEIKEEFKEVEKSPQEAEAQDDNNPINDELSPSKSCFDPSKDVLATQTTISTIQSISSDEKTASVNTVDDTPASGQSATSEQAQGSKDEPEPNVTDETTSWTPAVDQKYTEEKKVMPSIQDDETKPEQMSTILFKMDGTPFLMPPEPVKPSAKTVNFSSDDSIRPLSITSVESLRGEREGIPPLAGGEESDIDDSTQLVHKSYTSPSQVPNISPVKEDPSFEVSVNEVPDVETPEEKTLLEEDLTADNNIHEDVTIQVSPDHDVDDKKEEADTPLLDQTHPDADKQQKCCIIV